MPPNVYKASMYLCGTFLAKTFVGGLICVALKLLIVKSERSNYAQVLREFPVPKNSFHMSPRVLKAYFKSLMNLMNSVSTLVRVATLFGITTVVTLTTLV